MNTKGIKFLAVLTVLAFAFAAFAAIPSDEQVDASTEVTTYEKLVEELGKANADVNIPSTASITIPAGDTVTIKANGKLTVAGTLVNNGTISNLGVLTVNGESAVIKATSESAPGKITRTSEADTTALIVVTQGDVKDQIISKAAAEGAVINVNGTNAVNLKNLEFVTVEGGHGISVTAAATVLISNVTFSATSAVKSENLISINSGASAAIVTIENITLKNVTPDAKHGVLDISANTKVGPKSSTAANVKIDSSVPSMVWNDNSASIVDDLSIGKIYLRDTGGAKTLNVAAGKTLTADVYTGTANAKIGLTANKAAFIGTFQMGTFDSTTNEFTATASADLKLRADNASVDITASTATVTVTGTIDTTFEGSKIAQKTGTVAFNPTALNGTDGEVALGGEITTTGITIPTKVRLLISEDAKLTTTGTITITGILEVLGTLTGGGLIAGAGILELGDDAVRSTTGTDTFSGQTLPAESEYEFGIEGVLDSDFTINTAAYLSNDLIIPEGITLYVNGKLNISNFNLTVYGDLVIGSKGTITSLENATKSRIIIGLTGEIDNDGVIGEKKVVKVEIEGIDETHLGEVTLLNVTGVEFGIEKLVTVNAGVTTVKYYLAIGGDVSVIKGRDNYKFEATNIMIGDMEIKDLVNATATPVKITGTSFLAKDSTLTIGKKAQVVLGITMMNNSTLEIDGKIVTATSNTPATADIFMWNGAAVIINGNADGILFQACTGEFETYNAAGQKNNPETMLGTKVSNITMTKLTAVTIKVSSKMFVDEITGKSMTEQMLSISGDAEFFGEATTGSLTIGGLKTYILTQTYLSLPDGATFATTNPAVIVTEGILSLYDNDQDDFKFIGAAYEMKFKDEKGVDYTVFFFTNFDLAYASLSVCEDKTIYLMGGFEFTGEYTINADENIIFLDAFDTAKYTISIDSVFIVKEDAIVSILNAAKAGFTTIEGILYVEVGGSCVPDATAYQVSSKDDDGNMTYTGIAKAIADAEPGDVITLTQSAKVTTLLTVPYMVALVIENGVKLEAQKGLTVNGILTNKGTVTVTGADLTVAGVYDNKEGTTTCSKEVTVTGIYSGAVTADVINAAHYTADELVYTTPAAAALAVSLMDVPVKIYVTGTVVDTEDVLLAEGVTIEIDGTLKAPAIYLEAGAKIDFTANGKLTTTVYGDEEDLITTVPSIKVTDLTAAAGTIFKVTYSESTKLYTTTMSGFTGGKAVIDTGSVTFTGTTMNFSKDLSLKVSTDATLVTSENVTFTDTGTTKYFAVTGTWYMKNGGAINGTTLAGMIYVPAGQTIVLTSITLTGNIVLEDATSTAEAAKATINDKLIVGSPAKDLGAATASIEGKITIASGYVLVYGDSTFSTTVDGYVSTAVYVNDELFATVYGSDSTTMPLADPITKKVKDLSKAGYDTTNITWYSGTTEITSDPAIGKYAKITTTLYYTAVDMVYSIEPGVYVYIDGKDITTLSSDKLTVGTHTIKTFLKTGYEGEIKVTLNGKAVPVTASGLTIDITVDMQETYPTLVVSGATPIPEPEPVVPEKESEWTITTILLVVLVILIAIMAVIVALRLNRS